MTCFGSEQVQVCVCARVRACFVCVCMCVVCVCVCVYVHVCLCVTWIRALNYFKYVPTFHFICSAKSVFWQVEEYSLVGVFVCFARVWAFVDECVCVCVCVRVCFHVCLSVCLHKCTACLLADRPNKSSAA